MSPKRRAVLSATALVIILLGATLVPLNLWTPSASAQTPPANPRISSLVAGDTANYVFTFTTGAKVLAGNGEIRVDFPDASGLPWGFAGVSATLTGAPVGGTQVTENPGVQPDGVRSLRIFRTGLGAQPWQGAVTLRVNNVMNPLWTNSVPGGVFTVVATYAGDTAPSPTGTYTNAVYVAAPLTAAAASTPFPAVNQAADHTFSFDTNRSLPAGARIRISLPADFAVTGPLSYAAEPVGLCHDGTTAKVYPTPVVASSTSIEITQVRECGSPGHYSLPIRGLTNPKRSVLSGGYTLAFVTAATAGDRVYATGAASPQTFQAADGAFTAVSAVPADSGAGASSTHTVTFTTTESWPATGFLAAYFPPTSAGATAFQATGPSATLVFAPAGCGTGAFGAATTVSGNNRQTFVFPRTGAQGACGPGQYVVAITNIKNPNRPQTVEAFAKGYVVALQDQDGIDQQANAAPAPIQIVPGTTGLTPSWAGGGQVGTDTSISLAFTSKNLWPADGTATILFPLGINPATFDTVAITGCSGSLSATAEGQVLKLVRTGTPADCAPGSPTITVTGVTLPPKAGKTLAWTLSLYDGDDALIEQSAPTVPASLVLPAKWTQAQASLGELTTTLGTFASATDLAAGAVADYTFTIGSLGRSTPSLSEWKTTDRFAIGFPAGYDLSGIGTKVRVEGPCMGASKLADLTIHQVLDNTVILARPATQAPCTNSEDHKFIVTGVGNPAESGPTGAFYFATRSAAGLDQRAVGNGYGPVASPTLQIGAGSITGAIVKLANRIAGASPLVTVEFPLAASLPVGAGFDLEFPAGFTLSNTPTMSGGLESCDGTVSVVKASASKFTFTRGGAQTNCAPGTKIFKFNGVTNPSASGDTGVFALTAKDAASAVIAQDLAIPAVNILPVYGPLADLAITIPGGLDYGGATGATLLLEFESVHGIEAGGQLRIPIPAGLDADAATITSLDGPAACSTPFTLQATAAALLLTNTNPADACGPGAYELLLAGLETAPAAATLPMSLFLVGTDGRDTEAAGPLDLTIRARPLPSLTIVPVTPTAASVSNYEFKLKSNNAWPGDGKINVSFPAGYAFTPDLAAQPMSNCPGHFSSIEEVEDRKLQLVRDGSGAPCSGGATPAEVTIRLAGIVNPGSSTPGRFDIEILDADEGIVGAAYDALGPALQPQGSTLPGLTIEEADLRAGASTTTWANFTTTSVWPSDGQLAVQFPSGFDVSGVAFGALSGCPGVPQFSKNAASRTLTLTRTTNPAACPAGSGVILSFNGVNNPGVAGPTAPFSVMLKDAAGADLDANHVVPVIIEPGTLGVTIQAPTEPEAGDVADYTIKLDLDNPWPADGKLLLALPAGYSVGSVTGAVLNIGGTDHALSIAKTSNPPTLTLTRQGGAESFASATLKIADLANPTSTGPTDAFLVQTRDSLDQVIDESEEATVTIAPTGFVLLPPIVQPADNDAGAKTSYDLTFTPRSNIPADACYRVTFADDFTITGPVDATVTRAGAINVPIETDVDGQNLDLHRTSGAELQPSATTIHLTNITNPAYSGPSVGPIEVVTLENGNTPGETCRGADIDGAYDGSVALDPDPMTGSVTITDAHVGRVADYQLTLTNAPAWAVEDVLRVKFPAHFDLQSIETEVTESLSDGGLVAEADLDENAVLVSRVDADFPWSAATKDLRILGIINPPTAGSSYGLVVELVDVEDRVRARDDAVPVPEVLSLGGALSELSAEASDDTIATLTDLTIGFTTVSDWPEDAGMRIQLPATYDLAELATAIDASEAAGTFEITDADAALIEIQRTGGLLEGPADVELVLSGVRNPFAGGSPGPITITTLNADGEDLDVGSVAAPSVVGTSITMTVSGAQRTAGELDVYTFEFTTTSDWPGQGTLELRLPAAYDASGAEVQAFSGCDDGLDEVDMEPELIVLRRQGDDACAAGEGKKLVLADVRNPNHAGPTGAFVLELQDADGNAVGGSEEIDGPEIHASSGSLRNAVLEPVTPTDALAGNDDASYHVEFMTTSATPVDGFFALRFPAGYDVSDAAVPADAFGACTALTTQTGSDTLLLRKLSTSCPPDALRSFTVTGIENPPHAGPLDPIVISIRDTNGRDAESVSMPVDIVAGALSIDSIDRVQGSSAVGELASYSIVFTHTNPIPAGGRILVHVPVGSDVSDVEIPLLQNCAMPISGVDGADDLITIELGTTGASSCPGGEAFPKTLRINDLRNPGKSGDAPAWRVETQRSNGDAIDESSLASGPAMAAQAGPLTDVMLTAEDPLVGATTPLLIEFTTGVTWPAGGKFLIDPPAGFGWDNPTAMPAGSNPCPGGFTLALDEDLLTLTRTGPDACPVGAHAIRLTGLVNGPDDGDSPPFHVSTQTPEGHDLQGATDATVELAPAMTDLSATPADLVAGAKTTYTLEFHTIKSWPQDGYLLVGFPATAGITTAKLQTLSVCDGTTLQKTTLGGLPSNFVALKLLGGACPAAVREIVFTEVVNPPVSGAHHFRLSLTGPIVDGAANLRSGTEDLEITLLPTSLTATSLKVTPGGASHIAQYLISYTASVPLPPGSAVRVTFPGAYGFDDTITAGPGTGTSPTFTASEEDGHIDAVLQGTTSWASGKKSILLGGVRNPVEEGDAPDLLLEYVSAEGDVFASGTIAGPDIGAAGDLTPPGIPGPLTSTSELKLFPAWSAGLNLTAVWTAPADTDLAGYSYSIDNILPDATVNSTSASGLVKFPTAGAHTFHVRAVDKTGNAGDIQTYSVRLDNEKPVLGTLAASSGVTSCTTDPTSTVTWPAATDTGGSGLHPTAPYKVAVGTGAATAVTGTTSSVNLVKGINKVNVAVFDAAGNSVNKTIDIKRDVDPPTVELTVPPVARGPFEVSWKGTDDCSSITQYRLEWRQGANAAFVALYEGPLNKTIVAAPEDDGALFFRVRATDAAGRSGTITAFTPLSTIFDATPPTPPANPEAKPLAQGAIKLSWLPVTDGTGSGIAGYHVYRADAADGAFTKITTQPVATTAFTDTGAKQEGAEYYYQVAAADLAGNEGTRSLSASAAADNRNIVAPGVAAATRIGELLGLGEPVTDLKAIDTNADGRYDGAEHAAGLVGMRTALVVSGRQALLLNGTSSNDMVLWMPTTDEVLPVEPAPAEVLEQETEGNITVVTVRVQKSIGWILIDAEDVRPRDDVVRVEAADGRVIPLEQVFREKGRILVLDDPDVTYELVYERGISASEVDARGGLPGFAIWIIVGAAALVIALSLAGVLVYRRRVRARDELVPLAPEERSPLDDAPMPEQSTTLETVPEEDATADWVDVAGQEPTQDAELDPPSTLEEPLPAFEAPLGPAPAAFVEPVEPQSALEALAALPETPSASATPPPVAPKPVTSDERLLAVLARLNEVQARQERVLAKATPSRVDRRPKAPAKRPAKAVPRSAKATKPAAKAKRR